MAEKARTDLAYDKESGALHFFAEWRDRAAPAVPAIIDLLKTSNDPVIRRSALFTLKKIGTKEALQGYQQFSAQPEGVASEN